MLFHDKHAESVYSCAGCASHPSACRQLSLLVKKTKQVLSYAAAYCSLAICSLPHYMLLLCMGCCAQHVRRLSHVPKERNRSAIVIKQSQQGHPQATALSSHCLPKPSGSDVFAGAHEGGARKSMQPSGGHHRSIQVTPSLWSVSLHARFKYTYHEPSIWRKTAMTSPCAASQCLLSQLNSVRWAHNILSRRHLGNLVLASLHGQTCKVL